MKKFIAALLALSLMLSLTGCISAEEKETVNTLMAKIDQLADIDLDDLDAIEEAQSMYDGLSDKAKERVENYAVLEEAHTKYLTVFTESTDTVTKALEQINAAMDAYDTVTIIKLLEENLPLARKVVASKYFVAEENPVEVMENVQTLMGDACYPNTHILSLKNYAKLTGKRSGVTSAEETTVNVNSDNKMEYTTYFCNSISDMSDIFIDYTTYLKKYFELDTVKTVDSVTYYYFLDDQGRSFYVAWAYYNLGYYGSISSIYVGFAPEIGFADAVKK